MSISLRTQLTSVSVDLQSSVNKISYYKVVWITKPTTDSWSFSNHKLDIIFHKLFNKNCSPVFLAHTLSPVSRRIFNLQSIWLQIIQNFLYNRKWLERVSRSQTSINSGIFSYDFGENDTLVSIKEYYKTSALSNNVIVNDFLVGPQNM